MFAPSAADSDGDALVFGISGKPAWASFDTASGRLTGTPASADAGTYQGIVISVSDGDTQSTLPAFDLTVNASSATNRAPVISGTPAAATVAGAAYAFTPTASDADGNSLSFTIRKTGLGDFNPTTGALKGLRRQRHAVPSPTSNHRERRQAIVALPPFSSSSRVRRPTAAGDLGLADDVGRGGQAVYVRAERGRCRQRCFDLQRAGPRLGRPSICRPAR